MARKNEQKYGLEPQTWQAAKAEVIAILIQVAQSRTLITYSELASQLQTLHAHPGSYVFTALLRQACTEEEAKTGVMLCALVVAKATGKPGAGYFKGMPCDSSDLIACWQAECEAVYATYQES